MTLQEVDLCIETVRTSHDLSHRRAQQIIDSSKQYHILDTTPKDATERFASHTSIMNKLLQPHFMLLLVDQQTDDLAGLAWFRPTIHSPVQHTELTYAHRLYEKHTGRGLSIPFARATHELAAAEYGPVGVWLETRIDNTPAVRTYEAVGYKPCFSSDFILTMTIDLPGDLCE